MAESQTESTAKNATLTVEKETKNTVKYEAETNGQPPITRNVYLQKWIFDGDFPEEIELEVEW